MIDIVTVHHNSFNKKLALDLSDRLEELEPGVFNHILHDNSVDNVGFAAGCNFGAKLGSSNVIGFLNPDVVLHKAFSDQVVSILSIPGIEVTGNRFGKHSSELEVWGVKNWVCGAVFFTTRYWWDKLGGFDEQFVWSFEETDFIRRTEALGGVVRSANLPITHDSPVDDSEEDREYKERYFEKAKIKFYEKWSSGGCLL